MITSTMVVTRGPRRHAVVAPGAEPSGDGSASDSTAVTSHGARRGVAIATSASKPSSCARSGAERGPMSRRRASAAFLISSTSSVTRYLPGRGGEPPSIILSIEGHTRSRRRFSFDNSATVHDVVPASMAEYRRGVMSRSLLTWVMVRRRTRRAALTKFPNWTSTTAASSPGLAPRASRRRGKGFGDPVRVPSSTIPTPCRAYARRVCPRHPDTQTPAQKLNMICAICTMTRVEVERNDKRIEIC